VFILNASSTLVAHSTNPLMLDFDGRARVSLQQNGDNTTSVAVVRRSLTYRTVANITSITLSSSVASAFSIGSYIKVYRLSSKQAAGGNGQGGAALEYVGEATVSGAAATSLSINGLALDSDETYVVQMGAKNATASVATLSLTYNADTTAANYFTSVTSNGASTQSNNANLSSLYGTTASEMLINLTISRPVSRVTANGTVALVSNSGTNIRAQGIAHQWTTTATNVTGLTITSSVANALDIGTYIRVWRLKRVIDQTLTITATRNIGPSDVVFSDTALSIALPVGTYSIDEMLSFTCANGGIQRQFNFTGTATNVALVSQTEGASSASGYQSAFNVVGTLTVNGSYGILRRGTFEVTAAGSLVLQVRQNTSNVGVSTLNKGSWLRIRRIA